MGSLEAHSFAVADYAVFIGFLVASGLVGLSFFVWPLIRGRRQTTEELLLGGGNVGILPVTLTLVATYVSAISILGYPADVYACGAMFSWYGPMYVVMFSIAALVYLPVYYRLGLTSAYQYFALRFSEAVRLSASLLFCVYLFLYLAVVLYAPALALSVVTPLPLTFSILVTGLLATLYTSLGGAKAVFYTNTVQMLIIILGLAGVAGAGIYRQGGLERVWALAERGGRLDFVDFRPDPRVRHSAWSLVIGGSATMLTLFAANQMTIQRYLSMATVRKAQATLFLNIPINIGLLSLFVLIGLSLFAEFAACDPVKQGLLSRYDETLPYYVLAQLGALPGLSGLFVAALYGAGLSTLSGGLNAVAAVIYVDFVRPGWRRLRGVELAEAHGSLALKAIVVLFGVAVVAGAFACGLVSASVLQVALSVYGMVGGPLLGAFSLGMFTPFANAKGTLVGIWLGFAFTAVLGLGAVALDVRKVLLPMGDCSQPANASTAFSPRPELYNRVRIPGETASEAAQDFFGLSYQYYSIIAAAITFIAGTVLSLASGSHEPSGDDPALYFPPARRLWQRFGYRFRPPAEEAKEEAAAMVTLEDGGGFHAPSKPVPTEPTQPL